MCPPPPRTTPTPPPPHSERASTDQSSRRRHPLSARRAHTHTHLLSPPPHHQAKSKAIPFLNAPPALDGTMAGDVGFDPLLLSNIVPLKWSREAELKHARVCMLAVAGWVAVDLGMVVPLAPKVSSLAAHDAAVDKGPMFLLLLGVSVVEIVAGIPKVHLNPPPRRPAPPSPSVHCIGPPCDSLPHSYPSTLTSTALPTLSPYC